MNTQRFVTIIVLVSIILAAVPPTAPVDASPTQAPAPGVVETERQLSIVNRQLSIINRQSQIVNRQPVLPVPSQVEGSGAEGSQTLHPTAEITVCPAGTGTCDYDNIQAAVDAANPGDVIKVAAGRYTGVQGRLAPVGYNGPSVITQVVYISKTVTIQGGYTTTNWITPNPVANPTELDAQGSGRVLFIAGSISPTVEGLRITGGDATGLLGHPHGNMTHGGSGVYIVTAAATLSNCRIFSNTASTTEYASGGGLYLYGSDAVLSSNTIISNTANGSRGSGGGVGLYRSAAIIRGNIISANSANNSGGGLGLDESLATLVGNTILGNIVDGSYGAGGGLYLTNSSATLVGNTILSNIANGIYDGSGGGLCIGDNSDATLTNNIIADNQASNSGSGLYIGGGRAHLLHTTIAHNGGGDGSGIYVTEGGLGGGSAVLTNTILVNQAVGIYVTGGDMGGGIARLEGTLWGSGAWANGADLGGDGTIITGAINLWGDPAFVDPDAGNYHISPRSAAIDAGVDAGVTDDIDGDLRADGRPDIGADELAGALIVTKQADPDPVQPGAQLTYTIHVFNGGDSALHTTITDTLPTQVTTGTTPGGTVFLPGGTITWTGITIPPGGVWTYSFAVTVEMEYEGPLINVVQVTTEEGPTAAYTETSTVATTPPPGVPNLLSPPNGTVTTTQAVTFKWQAGAGGTPDGYNLELDGVIITSTGTTSPTILSFGVHTWSVRAFNAAGYSDWATAWTVEITETVPPTLPGVPTLLAPPNGTITTTQAITFAWQAGAGAAPTGYNLELDGAVITTTGTTSSTILSYGVHTWTVRAFNAAGYSDWAAAWTVEVTETVPPTLPDVPILIAPPDDTVTTTQAITFKWQAGAGAAPTGYNLEIDGAIITTTGTTSPTFLTFGVHTWTVRAFNTAGYSAWAEAWRVEVKKKKVEYYIYLPVILKNR